MPPKTDPAVVAAVQKVRTVPFKGELPKRGGGFTRQSNPFDELFAKLALDEEGCSEHMLTEVKYEDPVELKPVVALLRNAAKFIDKGLDVWTVENGIVWRVRPVRAKGSRNQPATAEAA